MLISNSEVIMSVKTNNIYGKIIISDRTIEKFVSHISMDCYGIVEFSSRNFFDSFLSFFKKKKGLVGVKVRSAGDRVNIEVAVIVKYGVSIKAVAEALKESLKYKVERFTGMLVDTINVKIMGVKL